MKKRVIAAACVLAAGALALAAVVGEHLVITPSIATGSAGAMISVMADNDGTLPIDVTGIGMDASCAMTDGTTIPASFANHPTNMFMFQDGTLEAIMMMCPVTGPSSNGFGIRRCEFFVKKDDTPSGRLADFTALCLYMNGNTTLSAMPVPVMFGNVGVGSAQPASFTVSATASVGSLYFSIADGEGNFQISAPCLGSGPHCVDANPLMSGANRTVTVTCTPQRAGTLDTVMYVIANTGDHATPISLQCTGVGAATGADINLSTESVTLIQDVDAGPVTDNITLQNASATDSLTITSMALAGSPDWGMAVSSPCNSIPCTLPPGQMVDIMVVFDPSTAGTIDATITITSNDPDEPTKLINLNGTGTETVGNLSITPAMIALGEVRIDGLGPRVVETMLLDTNGPTLTVTSGPLDQPDAAQVTFGALSSTTIAMGSGATFDVRFDPGTVEGAVSTMIEVTAGPDTVSVPFTANVVRAELAAPADVDFGSICVGQAAAPRTLKLVSTGSATIHMAQRPELEMLTSSPFSLTRVSPDDAGYPATLLTNDEATVNVAPKSLPAGTYVDHVAWMTDATSPRTRLEVDYVADGGGISPGAVSFGMAQIRQTSETQTVTIQNCAAGTLSLSPPEISPAGEFMAISALPASLAPGETATLTLVFAPQQAGVRTATLTIPTSTGDLAVDLSGTGIGDGVAQSAPASLYACDCASSDPAGGMVILAALVFPLIPRRRRR